MTEKPTKPRGDKVLVVDDDEFVCNSLKWLLLDEGYDVAVAPEGKTACEMLSKHTYDLVLTDLMMPDVDGLAVLRRTKETSPDTAVIILTGYGTLEAAMSALKQGAYDFLTKPCDDGEMKYKIRGALEHRRLRRRVANLEDGSSTGLQVPEVLSGLLKVVDEQLRKIQSQPPEQAAGLLQALRERLQAVASTCECAGGKIDPAELRAKLDEIFG